MAFKPYREESRKDFGTHDDGLTLEQINTGSFLRMADAMEKMSGNYIKLENDLKWYKQKYAENRAQIETLWRSNAALRGHVKRLKRLNHK